MQRFLSFLVERAAISARGPKAERYTSQYIKPFVGQQNTHQLKTPARIGDVTHPAGQKITIHDTKIIDGVHHAQVSVNRDSKEWVPHSKIEKPGTHNSMKAEESQISGLRDQISKLAKKHGGSFQLHVGDRVVRVASAAKVPGAVKADVVLKDENGVDVHMASLKKSAQASSFNGYGGFSHLANHPAFKRVIDKLKDTKIESGHAQFVPFKKGNKNDEDATRRVVFGKEHPGNVHGVSNVHSIHHGNIVIRPHPTIPNAYQLHSDLDIHNNSDGSIRVDKSGQKTLQTKSAIEAFEHAHGHSIGVVARKGEQGERRLPGTDVRGVRTFVGTQNYRKPDKMKVLA